MNAGSTYLFLVQRPRISSPFSTRNPQDGRFSISLEPLPPRRAADSRVSLPIRPDVYRTRPKNHAFRTPGPLHHLIAVLPSHRSTRAHLSKRSSHSLRALCTRTASATLRSTTSFPRWPGTCIVLQLQAGYLLLASARPPTDLHPQYIQVRERTYILGFRCSNGG